MPTIWVDLSDLLDFLGENALPSGIQRVSIELARALVARNPQHVRFIWRYNDARSYAVISWTQIEAWLASAAPSAAFAKLVQTGRALQGQGLPSADSTRPFDIVRTQWAVLKTLMRATRGQCWIKCEKIETLVRPGDIFFVSGSPWRYRDYATTVRWVRDRLRMRFVVLVHDLIPVVQPQWYASGMTEVFTHWHRTVLPLTDHVLANSAATARDLAQFMARHVQAGPPVSVLPFGCAFQPSPEQVPGRSISPIEGDYILFVSTIEGRKNHELLLRVWRRLIETMPIGAVPKLVLAGKRGWLVEDLMRQLEFSDWLDGHIIHISNASDSTLSDLYQGCLFTVFPSFYEGWGWPVVESLTLGKPCLAANTSSVPEAGGDFARYFNPRDVGDAYRAIRALLEDRAALAVWEQRVREAYVPPRWSAAADTLVALAESIGDRL